MITKLRQWTGAATTALGTLALWTGLTLAQSSNPPGSSSTSSGSVTTTTTSVMWYSHWWIWAVGVAVFLIIVIALTNRGGRSTT